MSTAFHPPDAIPSARNALMPEHLWRIWAKWSKTGAAAPEEGETYHPLICHLIDVATVARLLWVNALPVATRERLAFHLGLSAERDTAAWIAFFTGLHDLGKASPGFQDQLNNTPAGDTVRRWMRAAQLDFSNAVWVAHGAVSARVLSYMLEDLRVGSELADQIAALVGGHHGTFPRPADLNNLKERHQVGVDRWNTVREELLAALRVALRIPDPAPTGRLTPADAMTFAGFVTTADWIGSNEQYFHHKGRLAAAPQPLSLDEYLPLAEKAAVEAMRAVRMDPFIGATAGRTRRTFGDLFPHIREPYDAQRAVIELASHLNGPALVILEAPMGEGKTEAALYLADNWAAMQGRQGTYIALPTQATSNQMFKRVHTYLDRRFSDADYVSAHLVYGEAPLDDFYQQMLDQGRAQFNAASTHTDAEPRSTPDTTGSMDAASETFEPHQQPGNPTASDEPLPLLHEGPIYDGPGEQAGEEGTVIAVEWFAAPKRALLAPFGVGTIDQALLGVLQTRHFFVRLFGLAGKTVIVDEVHAYDTYMSALLDRLLEWLGAFGVPVVLLSATLPRTRREELQRAYALYSGWPTTTAGTDGPPYPRLTWLSANGPGARPVEPSSARAPSVQLHWLDSAPPDSAEGLGALGKLLVETLRDGGCAATVCNTVRRAQAVYGALEDTFAALPPSQRPDLYLLHAQMLREDRQRCEQFVLDAFGPGKTREPNPDRPPCAVLVATQVIEQSLDLDFDLMISDLAPVDLLLQRSGRLHRHRKNNPYRPPSVKTPRLLIPRPEERDGCPHFPWSDEFIYDPHILLRTWIQLQDRTQIRIPEDIADLVERVYDPDASCPEGMPPAVRSTWEASRGKQERSVEHDLDEARMRRVPSPKDDTIYTGRNLSLKDADEAPSADDTALALTRLGPPSVRAILLPTAWARRQLAAKGRPPGREMTRKLLGRSVSISHAAVAPALIQLDSPTTWKKSPWLRHARLVALDSANQATIVVPNRSGSNVRTYTLTLDSILGVVIQRQAVNPAIPAPASDPP